LAITISTLFGVVPVVSIVTGMRLSFPRATVTCVNKITKRASKENIPARRGRPRSEAADRAILEAALALMAREGYARMSVDAVALQAGVGKPTLYLRYPSKAALATAALAHAREQTAPKETGDTRADLVALLRHFRAGVERPFGMALIGTVLAEEHHTPELFAQFQKRLVEPRRQMLRGVLERARARGELAPEADLETAVNMLVGSYYAGYLASGRGPRDWPERTVQLILGGLLPDNN
jgi:AcrR family transcriptional regulator